MNNFSREKQIDVEILKRKKTSLKRERMLSVFKKRVKFLIYVPFLFLFFYLLFYSPFFVIKEIEVNELVYMEREEITQDFEVLKSENFFLTNLSFLREEVIKKYAFIENIYTEKVFPNKVVVHVREKEPFLVVNNEYGCFLTDRWGFVLLESECTYLKSNYSVKEVLGKDLNNIDFVVNTQSNFYNAEKIHEINNVLDYYGYNVKTIEIESQVVELKLHDSRSFIFTFADDIDTQLKRFVIINTKIDHENMSFLTIDMRYSRPVLTEQ